MHFEMAKTRQDPAV